MILKKPTLIVIKKKVEDNIARMLAKIGDPAKFRPHFKTHYSQDIGAIFKEHGVSKITVSSVEMASYFSSNWDDITIAFPVNLNEIEEINKLSSRVKLNLLVESSYSANFLATKLKNNVGIFIKIDTGYNRTGIQPSEDKKLNEIISITDSCSFMTFKGFITHAGHTYSAKGKIEILSILEQSLIIGKQLKEKYSQFPDIIFSYGDTPSCSMADSLDTFDELRPGNFVYYDVMQYHIGSCKLEDIAVSLACPVVAVHPERNEIVIYGGSVHLSKEAIDADGGFKLFGYVAEFEEGKDIEIISQGWNTPLEGTYVKNLSQEHGIIHTTDETIKRVKPGDWLGILPVHSCLTANLLREDQRVV